MKHLFIVNPVAGKGKAMEYVPQIKKLFENKNDIYFIEITEKPGHATEIVKRYVNTESFRVYSIGGDGTLNEVLNGLAGSDSSLAVLPGGSGNDFIRSVIKSQDTNGILKYFLHGL
jgi:diacylglycerol kinase family enzyme